MKNLTGVSILATFLPPKTTKIHNNKIFIFCETDVLTREVLQKSISALPCCMGSIFFVIRTQRGSTIFAFCDTSPARRRFFHFSDTSPARIKKINKIALRSYGFDASARKSPKANRKQIVILLRQVRSGRAFQIAKKMINRFKDVCNTQGTSIITTWALTCALCKFR